MTKAELRQAINFKFLMIKLNACKTKAEMREMIKNHFDNIKNS